MLCDRIKGEALPCHTGRLVCGDGGMSWFVWGDYLGGSGGSTVDQAGTGA